MHSLWTTTLTRARHAAVSSATIYGTRLRRTANGKRSIRVFSSAQGKCWKDTALTLYHNVWIWPWLAVVLWCMILKDEFAHISVSCHAASRGCSPKCRRQYCVFDPQLWKLLNLVRSQVGHRMSIRKAEYQPFGPVSRWRSWNRRLRRIRTEELPFLVALPVSQPWCRAFQAPRDTFCGGLNVHTIKSLSSCALHARCRMMGQLSALVTIITMCYFTSVYSQDLTGCNQVLQMAACNTLNVSSSASAQSAFISALVRVQHKSLPARLAVLV